MVRTSTPRSLSREGFDRLLALLDRDRDQAGLKYQVLHDKLLRFFEWRGYRPAEDLADETLDRVSRKLLEGVELRSRPAAYVYGVARNIAREAQTRGSRLRQAIPLGAEAEAVVDPASEEPSAELIEQTLGCLDHCLETLPTQMRRLVLLHHSGQGRGEEVPRLLEVLRIRPQTLWVRMYRLRKRLERCVKDCRQGRLPVRHSKMREEAAE